MAVIWRAKDPFLAPPVKGVRWISVELLSLNIVFTNFFQPYLSLLFQVMSAYDADGIDDDDAVPAPPAAAAAYDADGIDDDDGPPPGQVAAAVALAAKNENAKGSSTRVPTLQDVLTAEHSFGVLGLPVPSWDELGAPLWPVSEQDVKNAFKTMSIVTHPDKNVKQAQQAEEVGALFAF